MPMYNLIWKTTVSLRNYYRDEPNDHPNDNYNAYPITNSAIVTEMNLNDNYNAYPTTNSASFKYKSSVTGKTLNTDENDDGNNTTINDDNEVVVPLKYLSNFGRTLAIPLISFEIYLILTWSENCVLTDVIIQAAQQNNPRVDAATKVTYKIKSTNCRNH